MKNLQLVPLRQGTEIIAAKRDREKNTRIDGAYFTQFVRYFRDERIRQHDKKYNHGGNNIRRRSQAYPIRFGNFR